MALPLLWQSASAADDPHGTANSVECAQCHISHSTLGDILINSTDSLVATLCLSCHSPGGWVPMSKTLSSSQQAIPGTSGTSHSWNVNYNNADAGAGLPQSTALLEHLSADSSITCGTCHDPHSNTNSPFLRLDNSANLLCLDCHDSWATSSAKSYTGSPMSHPTGVALPSGDGWHNPPLDTDGNPQPSDGNTTNDFVLGTGGNVGCTACHGIHYSDSNSGTVDGP